MVDNKNIFNIYYDQQSHAVIMEWHNYATSAQFREGAELMLSTLTENKTYKVLADIRDMSMIGREDQLWIFSDFLPRALASGFQAIAVLKPENYFSRAAVEEILGKIDKSVLNHETFETTEQARTWLQNLPASLAS